MITPSRLTSGLPVAGPVFAAGLAAPAAAPADAAVGAEAVCGAVGAHPQTMPAAPAMLRAVKCRRVMCGIAHPPLRAKTDETATDSRSPHHGLRQVRVRS